MMHHMTRWCAVFLYTIAISSTFAESEKTTSHQKEEKQVVDSVVNRLETLKTNLPPGVSQALVNEAIDIIKVLVRNARADQATIYTFVRTLNRSIDTLTEDNCKCADFKDDVRAITRKLLTSSYTDEIFQNANLSHQIKVRIPLLIEDSLKLSGEGNKQIRSEFLDELRLLSRRFLESKRFSVGIGLSYSYLPRVKYTGNTRIDYSPFQSTVSGGSDLLQYRNEFGNSSYPSVLLSAKIPFLRVDADFTRQEETRKTITAVQFRDIDSSDVDLLSRSTVTSSLGIEYDFSAKAQIVELIKAVPARDSQTSPRDTRFDVGLGVGLAGLRVEDSVATEVKTRTDPTSRFIDLPAGQMIESGRTTSFNTVFWVADVSMRVSDEFRVAVEARIYDKKNSSDREVEVDGVTLTIGAAWFPTFF
ncbi:MAG: hypothetical protein HC882_02365 [Acidobacteria bacterium]|nr:hypothetical protein [Acidobacteriota bacterium]